MVVWQLWPFNHGRQNHYVRENEKRVFIPWEYYLKGQCLRISNLNAQKKKKKKKKKEYKIT